VYIHLFEWPGASFRLDKMPRQVTGAYLLADTSRTQLKVTKQGDGISVSLPAKPLDPLATVLVLTAS
jgi:alpha-L-fucosidase